MTFFSSQELIWIMHAVFFPAEAEGAVALTLQCHSWALPQAFPWCREGWVMENFFQNWRNDQRL